MSRHREGALRRGEARSAAVARKVLAAMKTIRREMRENGGIYPANGGAVNKSELARRAGIHVTTLFSPKQKRLGKRVGLWLEIVKKGKTVGRMRVRRTYAERAKDWEERYNQVVTNLALDNLKVQSAEAEREKALAELEKLQAEVAGLRQENVELRRQLMAGGAQKVSPLHKGEK